MVLNLRFLVQILLQRQLLAMVIRKKEISLVRKNIFKSIINIILISCLLVLIVFIVFRIIKEKKIDFSFWLLICDMVFLFSCLIFYNKTILGAIITIISFVAFLIITFIFARDRLFATSTLIRLFTCMYIVIYGIQTYRANKAGRSVTLSHTRNE
jgi:hypothetical protein